MKKSVLIVFIAMVLFPFVSGELFIHQLNDIYNVGDEVNSHITIIPNSNIADHFKVDLICGNLRTNIFNQYLSLQQGSQQVIDANTQVIGNYFTSITYLNTTNSAGYQNLSNQGNSTEGNTLKPIVTKYNDCYVDVLYGPEGSSSNGFKVSEEISVDIELNLDRYDPKANVDVNGIANRMSGKPVNGFVEVFVNSLGIYRTGTITNGVLELGFAIPENAKSGEHNLSVRTYESNFLGNVINEGYYDEDFRVNQKLKKLEVFTKSITVTPGEEFTYSVVTYDQADDVINQDISVVVYKPGDFVYSKKLVKPESEQKISFASNDTPGYWKIEATVGNLVERKIFLLEEISKIQTSLINDTLIVKNIGNVPYRGSLEITIGSTVEIKQLKLKLGETQKYKLRAPKGNYQITINDGSGASVLGSSFLTGNAVRIVDVRTGFLETLGNPIIWWLVVILFVLIIILVYLRRYFGLKKAMPENSLVKGQIISKKEDTIMRGSKELAYVVSVKIGAQNSPVVSQAVNSALHMAKESGAKVYLDGEYKLIILSPKLTKNLDNGNNAVKIARRIEEILNKHNRQYKEKIRFGIGINDGEIISEISNNQFKFTTTGGLISAAKRISNIASMKVLLSETTQRKVQGAVKTQKSAEGYWEITRVPDREQYKGFLDKFKGTN